MKLTIPPPPKISGRVIMIPTVGEWNDRLHPLGILIASSSPRYYQTKANEKIWILLKDGLAGIIG